MPYNETCWYAFTNIYGDYVYDCYRDYDFDGWGVYVGSILL